MVQGVLSALNTDLDKDFWSVALLQMITQGRERQQKDQFEKVQRWAFKKSSVEMFARSSGDGRMEDRKGEVTGGEEVVVGREKGVVEDSRTEESRKSQSHSWRKDDSLIYQLMEFPGVCVPASNACHTLKIPGKNVWRG